MPLSVLDLAPASEGLGRKAALDDSLTLAVEAEDTGYYRYWMAEHHGSQTFMSSATALLLGRAAEHTSTIRLGSGGVMLPNHSPLMVAEYYGTLATIYGERFDLGLGRAPGTDPITAAALRRGSADLNDFAGDIARLVSYLSPSPVNSDNRLSGAEAAALGIQPSPSHIHRHVRAIPGEGTRVPLWMLGSSTGGAQVAASLGLPFSFASHFAPKYLGQALATYRAYFQANPDTAQVEQPHTMAGVNVLVAPTQSEADELFTSYQLMKARLRRGAAGPLGRPQPTHTIDRTKQSLDPTAFVGPPDRVVDAIDEMVESYELDEVIVTSYAWDPQLRRRSYRLLAQAWNA
ncbi:MAG: LLM class flavin-dependent oxidoreductase [Actinomycetaceae bacterium]|nr:LLM class flavin-dependent oxidoreductase [Actinomycetaceae bacterium]